jgi:hypothetical protein
MRTNVVVVLGILLGSLTSAGRGVAQHEPSPFKMTLVFEGKKQLDARGTAMFVYTDPKSGRIFSKEDLQSDVALPVKVSFENLQKAELKLSTRDYRFALLDPEGNVIPGGIMLPYDSDPMSGLPTRPSVRELSVADKRILDDPKMTVSLGDGRAVPRLKSGRYTLVCVMQNQIASVAFDLKVDPEK